MSAMTFTWRGKTPDQMTKEELVTAINEYLEDDQRIWRMMIDNEIERLKQELKIKDDIINRMIRGAK